MNENERKAVSLYAILAYDICDFLDELPDAPTEALEVLLQMLQHENPKHDEFTKELNADGAKFVSGQLEKRKG